MPIVDGCGGNVRVRLEDSLRIGKGRLAQSNTKQVKMARQILSIEIAKPDEARAIFVLKQPDKVLC